MTTTELTTGPDVAEWPVWTTSARLVVTDPTALADATTLVKGILAEIDRTASRFRPDSELMRVPTGVPTHVSPLLARMVAEALLAADRTHGAVDPTVGGALVTLGYDRDITQVGAGAWEASVVPGWRSVRLVGTELTVPDGVVLDLGATGKAFAADRCADLVSQLFGTGVLVSLGGDIATAGPGDWRVAVADEVITLPAGAAIATSSTEIRTWRRGGREFHHVLDPVTGLPARRVWSEVSVVADRCVDANTLSTASLVRGAEAPALLRRFGVPARLTTVDGSVRRVGGWP
ncbi:FAD:protein FMN transferase [Kibdelosporangium lantanae]